jgi:hypothetical protein
MKGRGAIRHPFCSGVEACVRLFCTAMKTAIGLLECRVCPAATAMAKPAKKRWKTLKRRLNFISKFWRKTGYLYPKTVSRSNSSPYDQVNPVFPVENVFAHWQKLGSISFVRRAAISSFDAMSLLHKSWCRSGKHFHPVHSETLSTVRD